jgi:hypothetical protein
MPAEGLRAAGFDTQGVGRLMSIYPSVTFTRFQSTIARHRRYSARTGFAISTLVGTRFWMIVNTLGIFRNYSNPARRSSAAYLGSRRTLS